MDPTKDLSPEVIRVGLDAVGGDLQVLQVNRIIALSFLEGLRGANHSEESIKPRGPGSLLVLEGPEGPGRKEEPRGETWAERRKFSTR